jgi:type III pantothenate kinase
MSSTKAAPYAFCEFGNTSVKIRYRHQTITLAYAQESSWASHTAALIASLPELPTLCLATVAPQRTAEFLHALHLQGIECLVCLLHELLPPDNPVLPYAQVQGIGIDRLLGLLGARQLCAPPIITVDCGTAITVTVLSSEGECLGGAIFASAPLQLRALAAGTAALPAIEFAASPSLPRIGTTTEEALLSGTFASVLGGIRELLYSFARQLSSSKPPAVVLTGGGSPPFVHALRRAWRGKFVHRPHLVLEGMEYLVHTVAEQISAYVRPLNSVSL